MWYREDTKGQILQEGINEAGAISEWIAAATAYTNHGISMIPFYIFYSMFGFQRVGDLCMVSHDQLSSMVRLEGLVPRRAGAGFLLAVFSKSYRDSLNLRS